MAEVKWIKLSTSFPGNRKIKQLRTLPQGDTIALMWVFLMCLAGETNDDGLIYFTPEIPFTDEMLATEFGIDINTIRLGLNTFEKFGMAEIVDDMIRLNSWEKWQSVERLSEIREYNRIAQQKTRAKRKALKAAPSVNDMSMTGQENVNDNVNDKSMTCQRCHDTDIDIDIDIDKEIDIDISDAVASKPAKVVKHKYGEYKNVLLTDDELDKLKEEYPDYEERIERLSSYVASTGKSYKSHYATIRNWARKDKEQPKASQVHQKPKSSTDDFMDQLKAMYVKGG